MAEAVGISPVWIQAQYFDNEGLPLSNGRIWSYVTQYGETVPTYADSTGLVQNTNPIILDSSGRLQTGLFLIAGTSYRLVLEDQLGNQLSEVNDVATPKLLAGANITLDPPTGVGKVTISAAGPANINAYGHKETYTFWSVNNTPMLPDNSQFMDWNTIRKLPITAPASPDVTMNGSTISFYAAGSYTITMNVVLTPMVGSDWPTGQSIFGLSVPTGDYIQQSFHNRYDGAPGLSNANQSTSWTDTFTISASEGLWIDMSVFLQNINITTTPTFDLKVETSITGFGPQYTSDWPIPD